MHVSTDPDIELDNVNGDILEYYIWLVNKFNNKFVVGPMLRIDDIPDYYPDIRRSFGTRHQGSLNCNL